MLFKVVSIQFWQNEAKLIALESAGECNRSCLRSHSNPPLSRGIRR
jgi:hypothetical protein